MKKLHFLALLALTACSGRFDIPNDQVTQTLTEFGRKNTERQLKIHTGKGDLFVKLYDETPLHTANFLRLVKEGYYDDRGFYRIVKGVAVQGGGKTSDQLGYTVPAEFRPNLIHKRGALAMARYSGEKNPNKESSPTEFFLITKGRFYDADELTKYPEALRKIYLEQGGEMLYDNEYTVFGEVTKGFDVLDALAQQPLEEGEIPLNTVKFSIEVVE
jgi:cyclophilin family peptidyl-prolyl cis-trans isomerase